MLFLKMQLLSYFVYIKRMHHFQPLNTNGYRGPICRSVLEPVLHKSRNGRANREYDFRDKILKYDTDNVTRRPQRVIGFEPCDYFTIYLNSPSCDFRHAKTL